MRELDSEQTDLNAATAARGEASSSSKVPSP